MIIISSDHTVLSWVYNNYRLLLAFEPDDILLETENIIGFKRLAQKFDTIFDYNFQEGPTLNILKIKIIQTKYGIIIDQPDHTMKNIIQEYWGKIQYMR